MDPLGTAQFVNHCNTAYSLPELGLKVPDSGIPL